MSTATDLLIQAFRLYVTDGVPSTGENEPDKTEILAGLTRLSTELSAIIAGQASGMLSFETKALMDADTAQADGARAYVWGDVTPANNTFYLWDDGGSAWVEDATFIALITGADGADGTLAAASGAEVLAQTDNTKAITPLALASALDLSEFAEAFVPHFHMPDGTVGGVLRYNKLDYLGLADEMLARVSADMAALGYLDGRVRVRSDGRGFYRLRERLGVYDAGQTTTPIKIGGIGDSWLERWMVLQYLSDLLVAAGYPLGASGLLGLGSNGLGSTEGHTTLINGTLMTALSNFTVADISADLSYSGGALPGRYGPDGYRATCTGTNGAMNWTGIRAGTIKIPYYDGDGTFTYSADGVSPTTVVCAGSNALAWITISGLSTGSTHTLAITTAGNAGTVELYSPYATGMDGIELSKIANSGSTAPQIAACMDGTIGAAIMAEIDLEAAITLFGTNEKSQNVTPAVYATAQTSINDRLIACNAKCGTAAIIPAISGSTSGTFLMADYRDAVLGLHITEGLEYVNACDGFPSYAQNVDAWQSGGDGRHLSYSGAAMLARMAFNLMWGA